MPKKSRRERKKGRKKLGSNAHQCSSAKDYLTIASCWTTGPTSNLQRIIRLLLLWRGQMSTRQKERSARTARTIFHYPRIGWASGKHIRLTSASWVADSRYTLLLSRDLQFSWVSFHYSSLALLSCRALWSMLSWTTRKSKTMSSWACSWLGRPTRCMCSAWCTASISVSGWIMHTYVWSSAFRSSSSSTRATSSTLYNRKTHIKWRTRSRRLISRYRWNCRRRAVLSWET